MIVIDLGNQQALDPDAKAIRQIAVNPGQDKRQCVSLFKNQ